MTESSTQNRTVTLAGACVFAALAALLTLARAEVPFPLVPYLKIDFSEIPIVIAFFLFGPLSATITATIQWMFLNVQGTDAPLGPAIKLIAVLSTLLGLWVGNAFYHRVKSGRINAGVALSIMLVGGALLRVLAMTIVNYAVLIYVAPVFFGTDYLAFARLTLEKTTGWHLATQTAVLIYTLLFTALYNLMNLLVAAIPAGLIVSPVLSSFKHMTSMDAWLSRNLRNQNSSSAQSNWCSSASHER
jgi:riboflavin transporter FmnP